MPVVNTKGVATGFEIIPDGTYPAVFTRYKNGKSAAQQDKATAIFTLKGPKEMDGKTVPTDYSFVDDALWRWKGDMIKLGVPASALENPQTNTDQVMDLVKGRECLIKVGHREWQGRIFNTVDIIDKDSWSAPAPAAAAASKS